jgi:UDP-glucose 4-epimerase
MESSTYSPQWPCWRSLSSDSSTRSAVSTPATETCVLFGDEVNTDIIDIPLNDQYILVTGGLGFIGSHTSTELLKQGHNIIILDDLSNAFLSVFERIKTLARRHHESEGTKCPSAQLHCINYRDTASLRTILDAQAHHVTWQTSPRSNIAGVLHFAAFKAVEESIKQPLKYYANNVSGLIDFTTLLGEYGIKTFIFSSSATVYGTTANLGVPLEEEHCVHRSEVLADDEGLLRTVESGSSGITNPYGRTKWMCEAILADLAFSDPEWRIVALRYFNPIGCDPSGLLGEDPKGVPTNLLPVVVKVITGQTDRLSVFGADWDTQDGTAVRDFIHVTDLVKGHIAALTAASRGELQENFRTFNLGTGSGHTVMEVVAAMEQAFGRRVQTNVVSRRAGDVGSCVAVTRRSKQELHWKTEKSLADACADIHKFLNISGAF